MTTTRTQFFQAALDVHNVIEASAGTGKTYTIMSMVLELLIRGVPLESILLVTFTEKATAELRSRLRDRLSTTLAQEVGLTATERALLHRASLSVDRAQIFTIHGFANKILHEFSFLNDMPMKRHQGVPGDIFLREFHRFMEEEVSAEPELRAIASHIARRQGTSRLMSILKDAQSCHEELTPFSLSEFRGHLEAFADVLTSPSLSLSIEEFLKDPVTPTKGLRISNFIRLFERIIAGLRACLEGHGEWIEECLALHDTFQEKTPSKYMHFLLTHGAVPSRLTAEEVNRFTELLGVLGLHLRSTAVIAGRLLGARLAGRLSESKRDMGVVEFDDMILLLRGSLRQGSPHLAETLRKRYSHAIIDEFQDTDPAQWDIFRDIFLAGGSLSIVGDPKQAIYGFRGADLYTYLEARRTLLDTGRGVPISLDTNYRSSAAMVDTFNRIFTDPDRPWFTHAVSCSPSAAGRIETTSSIPLELLRPDMEEGDSREDLFHKHLDMVCRRLTDLLQEGVRPDEVFILSNTHSELEEMAEYLETAQIPYSFYKRGGLFQSEEAAQILTLLEAVANPFSRHLLGKACLTEFFPLDPREIVRRMHDGAPLPQEHLFVRWHQMSREGRMGAFLDELLEESGYLRRALAGGRGQALLRVTEIIRILGETGESQALTVAQLAEQLKGYISKRLLDEGAALNMQPSAATRDHLPGVQLLTMHKSKGLEARAVFLIGGLTRGKSGGPFLTWHHPDTGRRETGVLGGDPLRMDQYTREQAGEVERLYYVAFTRASERLFAPLFCDTAFTPSDLIRGRYERSNTHLCWLLSQDRLPGARVIDGPLPAAPLHREEPSRRGIAAPPALWSPETIAGRIGPRLFSYSSLHRDSQPFVVPLSFEREESGEQVSSGARFGSYVHELMELVDPSGARGISEQAWRRLPEIRRLRERCAGRYDLLEGEDKLGLSLCHQGWTAPVFTERLSLPGGLCILSELIREREFLFPVPSLHVEQGRVTIPSKDAPRTNFLRGFMDLIFRHQGSLFILDWKTDLLPAYEEEIMMAHAGEHYGIQALIYSAALCRLQGIVDAHTYNQRFGGILYAFLRGGSSERSAMVTLRPPFSELVPLLG